MNRAHTSYQAYAAVELSKGCTLQESFNWFNLRFTQYRSEIIGRKNLEIAYGMDLQHLSCYALTVEPKTALATSLRHQKILSRRCWVLIDQYDYLMNACDVNGLPNMKFQFLRRFRSRHNSNYWKGVTYLGIGPAAHSYNGVTRRWNVANNAQYMNALKENQSFFLKKNLSQLKIKYNEYIMIGVENYGRHRFECDRWDIQRFLPSKGR